MDVRCNSASFSFETSKISCLLWTFSTLFCIFRTKSFCQLFSQQYWHPTFSIQPLPSLTLIFLPLKYQFSSEVSHFLQSHPDIMSWVPCLNGKVHPMCWSFITMLPLLSFSFPYYYLFSSYQIHFLTPNPQFLLLSWVAFFKTIKDWPFFEIMIMALLSSLN